MVRIKSKISLMIFGILLLSLYFCINPLYIDFRIKIYPQGSRKGEIA